MTGLDLWADEGFARLKGRRVGLLCHQASVNRTYRHVLDLMLEAGIDVRAVFGPQHGPWGHTQDNMVEWEDYLDPRTGLPFHSLYGERRKPTHEQLSGLDVLVVDLQDVGCRVYTFSWTMTLCLEACAEAGVAAVVLDRPNPIGDAVEGPLLEPGYESFVGLRRVPLRHGMSLGELARWVVENDGLAIDLTIVPATGDTLPPWVAPSPNMPYPETAQVYPGTVLLEGTNLSEGRGTTRPFETIGAPWIDGWELAAALAAERLPGLILRPVRFKPSFQKHSDTVCGGVFLHVTDPCTFRPVLAGFALLREAWRLGEGRCIWATPPYEYEVNRLPIDILSGVGWWRTAVEEGWALTDVDERIVFHNDLWKTSVDS